MESAGRHAHRLSARRHCCPGDICTGPLPDCRRALARFRSLHTDDCIDTGVSCNLRGGESQQDCHRGIFSIAVNVDYRVDRLETRPATLPHAHPPLSTELLEDGVSDLAAARTAYVDRCPAPG